MRALHYRQPVPYECAQPYHPSSESHRQMFRPYLCHGCHCFCDTAVHIRYKVLAISRSCALWLLRPFELSKASVTLQSEPQSIRIAAEYPATTWLVNGQPGWQVLKGKEEGRIRERKKRVNLPQQKEVNAWTTFEELFSGSCPKTSFVFNLIDTYAKFREKRNCIICELKSRNTLFSRMVICPSILVFE